MEIEDKLTRAKLVKEIEILRNKEEELQRKLNVLDKSNQLLKYEYYVGKYFKKIENNITTCTFFHYFNPNNFKLFGIQIDYDTNNSKYSINNYNFFDPFEDYPDELGKEISKKEFDEHFQNLQSLLYNIIK